MATLPSHAVRNDASLTWESFSSSSSCGIAPSAQARGNPPQRSCSSRRTRHCRSPAQPQGRLCRGKPLSAWRRRTPRDYGLLEPPQSPAVVGERQRYCSQINAMAVIVIVTECTDGCRFLTHVIELCAVAEHEVDISNKLVWWVIVLGVPLVELGPDHRQVDRPFNDLVVVTSLHEEE